MTVRVDNLTVTYDDFNALDKVSHTFEPGTATAVMGVNGSGKTTLLESIAGLIVPSSGCIDCVPNRLAYVSQHPPTTWMPLTAAEVLAMGRYRQLGLTGWFRAVDRAAMKTAGERLGVNDLLNQSFGTLSGGQQQRVRIAQVLASEPDLLLLDEPITGLDIPSQDQIFAVVEDYARQGAVVVITTHHLDEARHCDVVVLLANRLIADGGPEEILTKDRLREAFGERILGDHREHDHDQEMILLDNHGHHAHHQPDRAASQPKRGLNKTPR